MGPSRRRVAEGEGIQAQDSALALSTRPTAPSAALCRRSTRAPRHAQSIGRPPTLQLVGAVNQESCSGSATCSSTATPPALLRRGALDAETGSRHVFDEVGRAHAHPRVPSGRRLPPSSSRRRRRLRARSRSLGGRRVTVKTHGAGEVASITIDARAIGPVDPSLWPISCLPRCTSAAHGAGADGVEDVRSDAPRSRRSRRPSAPERGRFKTLGAGG